jgi:hypothetical protein
MKASTTIAKNKLFKYAISSGNENLQSRLLLLRQTKSGTSLAKLTKELIKLTDSLGYVSTDSHSLTS